MTQPCTDVHIPLSRGGLVALISAEDSGAVIASGRWFAKPDARTCYALRNVRKPDGTWTTQMLHTFLTGWPEVDHINGDGLDNRRSNLRLATSTQNRANSCVRSDNTSGFKGVGWHKRRGWRAYIKIDGRSRHLGYFDSAEAAARAYDAASAATWGEYAFVNRPPRSDR